MDRDIRLLHAVRIKQQRFAVSVVIQKANMYYKYGGYYSRLVRISSKALGTIQQWGWDIKGDWELVDQRHDLRDKKAWLA